MSAPEPQQQQQQEEPQQQQQKEQQQEQVHHDDPARPSTDADDEGDWVDVQEVPSAVPSAPPAPPKAPAPLLQLKAMAEFEVVAAKGGCKLLVMGNVTAPHIDNPEAAPRPAVELCAVIDRSGSMRGEKLKLVLQSLEFAVRELSPSDRFGIVSYDHKVSKNLPLTNMDKDGQHKAMAAIRSITPGGSTFISGGLFAGLDEVMASQTTGTQKTVWLFTDGQANQGLQTTDDMMKGLYDKMGTRTDISVFTYGFGTNHNDEMLRALAEGGSGMYYYIGKAADIPDAFAESLGGLLTTAATAITVKFTPEKDIEVNRILSEGGVEKEGEYQFTFKDIYSSEERDFVLEMLLPEAASPPVEAFPVCQVTVSYLDAEGTPQTASASVTVSRVESIPEPLKPNVHVDKQRNRLEMAAAVKKAKREADAGDYTTATSTLINVRTLIGASVTANDEYCKELCAEVQECQEMLKPQQWSVGSKVMTSCGMSHTAQRACGNKKKSYKTPMQDKMITKSKGPSTSPAPASPTLKK